jgi:nitrate reductase NapAB chaperone NapD
MTSQPFERLMIRSYLVHVVPGRGTEVAARVAALPGCYVHPAINRDLLVVVSEATSGEAAENFDIALSSTAGVAGVALVSGFSEVR